MLTQVYLCFVQNGCIHAYMIYFCEWCLCVCVCARACLGLQSMQLSLGQVFSGFDPRSCELI